MVSVVMTTYNGEKYLGEQLRSIFAQTVPPDEIIICDDCSTDNTMRVITRFQQAATLPIKVAVNKERLGYSRNFRQALLMASGEFIFLCDQDDVWLPQKIETCLRILRQNPQIFVLSTGFRVIDQQNKIRGNESLFCFRGKPKLKMISWHSFIRHPRYPGMAMAVRRELLSERFLSGVLLSNPFSLTPGEADIPHDWLLNESAAYQDGLYFFSANLSAYRQHTSNTVGMALYSDRTGAFRKRGQYLLDMCGALEMIEKYRKDKLPFLNKACAFYRTRKRLFQERRVFLLLFFELLHLKYISLRSIAGDIYLLAGKSR